ncbi:DUF4837 family protein [Flavobacterium aciduliphilum]|uniref:Uncharacterized protein DUF4837 n=1 Tax=Flavobacterium aciduliphilum TaxID=1101402 RepID=A0A328YIJ9_9FLAO|nr:DUF4837 family protein [Flavobacterium aciduliphilum]RAR72863.1 uncharacterized protein DUF4837 [Flavobacterium aciduliphilum]
MNKVLFLCVIVLLCFTSCSFKEKKTTTDSSGKINNVSVIIDDQLWNGEVGDSIRNKFAAPVYGLPQEEPIFTLNQYPVKLLEGFMSNNRNIIVVKKESKSQFRIEKNEYANPQVVVHISGNSVQELLDTIEKNDSLIVSDFKKSEIQILQHKIKSDSLADTKAISKKFNIKIDIPIKYKLVLKKRNFLWYKKEITSGNLSLIFYQLPMKSIKHNSNIAKRITKIRDSIGRRYIHGAVSRTWMATEQAFSPFVSTVEIFKRKAYETRGSWELVNDFMNGPFINYALLDTSNKRILVVEGFCYASSKQKRDLVFELESIIKSIIFLKKK